MPKVNQGTKETAEAEAQAFKETDELTNNNDDDNLMEAPSLAMAQLAIPSDRDVQTIANGDSQLAMMPGSSFAFDEAPVFDQSEIAIPRLKLLQGLSTEVTEGDGKPGYWQLPGHDARQEVVFYPLGMTRNREFRNNDNFIQCKSPDAIHGIGDPGIECAKCPLQQWGDRDPQTGKGKPPACSLVYVYFGVELNTDEICLLSLQKTQVAAAKWINSMVVTKGGRFGKFAVQMASVRNQGPNGPFFTPKMTLAQVDPARLQLARTLATGPTG